ncbi:hypothetical protein ACNQGF_08430 [Flavobacterium sp. LB1P71]
MEILSSPDFFSGLERLQCTAGGIIIMDAKICASRKKKATL